MLSQDEVKAKLNKSLKNLLNNDSYLLENDVNERSISHRLAIYLEHVFEEWDVDCEYNRDHENPKQLNLAGSLGRDGDKVPINDTQGRTVFPDIIVHCRNTDKNLLVIEIKKTTSTISKDFDIKKLNMFKKQLKYHHAVFLRLKTGDNRAGFEEPEWI